MDLHRRHCSNYSVFRIEKRLGAYESKNDKREPAIRQIFEDAGCADEKLTEQPVKGLKAPNLICTLPGVTEVVIVVGAHFDLVEAGNGVVDNWSGASLLPSLYQGIASVPRRHTFRFVAFSGEEKGLVGSKAYVRELGKTHEQVIAMVNMDTLGLAETEVWVSHANPKLAQLTITHSPNFFSPSLSTTSRFTLQPLAQPPRYLSAMRVRPTHRGPRTT